MSLAAAVDRAVRAAGIPAHGVSIGDPADKATWRIHYNGASAAQRTAGAALIAAFDLQDAAVVAREAATRASELDDRKIQAIAVAVHQRFRAAVPGDTMTLPQWRQAIREAFDALG